MKIIEPSVEIITPLDGAAVLKHIELCGRVCYKSEDKITDDSAKRFVKMLIELGHESVLEHYSFSVRFICDRGISHEIVRHRIASFSQESTRYCNYASDRFGDEITFVEQSGINDDPLTYGWWKGACQEAERRYFALLQSRCSPQEARSVLPTCLKTEIIMTANLREWRHFLKLRTANAAHPDMRYLALSLLEQLKKLIPIVFDDVYDGRSER